MFKIIDNKINTEAQGNPRAGARVIFEGLVRNHNEGKAVSSLEYSSYEEMANKVGLRIVQEALARFDVIEASCIHRVGHLQVGDMAVWVEVYSEHRKEAFMACQYIIDEVKFRVPIWKCEHYEDGRREWVACHGCQSTKHVHEHKNCSHQHD